MLLNLLYPDVPPGTLVANLNGGYVIGLAIAYFVQTPHLAPEWRLLIITGLCGGLTSFSSFSAAHEMMFQQGRFGVFAGATLTHIGGARLITLDRSEGRRGGDKGGSTGK